MTSLIDIEGIGPEYSERLKAAGVRSVEALLEQGARPKGRKAIEDATGISHSQILRWVNHADLFRIKGVAGQYSELLEASGVDTVVELSKRKPANLHKKMLEVNEEKNLCNQPPSENMVTDWVGQAKTLGRGVHYK